MKRLQGGPFLSLVLSDWLTVANGSSGNMKMKLFFAHDDTLSFMLNSLNIYGGLSNTPPPYASGLILELYQNEDGQHSVKMLYHPEVATDPVALTLPGCADPCPLDRWVQLTSSVTPDLATWTRECQEGGSQSEAGTDPDQSHLTILLLLVGLLCLVLVLLPVTVTASRCRRHKYYSDI